MNMLNTEQANSVVELQKAWILRWNQRIDESMLALAHVQSLKQWQQLEISHLQNITDEEEQNLYLEALLLKGALLRAQGQKRKSSSWLRRIFNQTENRPLHSHFRLLFELGIDSWGREDISQALDYFLIADRKARNIVEKTFTQSNILWALESLDLERVQFESNLTESLKKVPRAQAAQVQNVQDQWTTYQMRKRFYQSMKLPKEVRNGQGLFFHRWVAALPYLERSSNSSEKREDSYLWQGSYRLRTLSGIWSPDDKNGVRLGDAIDRLYLWTWKWMAAENMSREKVIWTMDSILEQVDVHELSKENSLLLRNALSWLAVLDVSIHKKIEKLLLKLQGVTSLHYPVLNAELSLIYCLFKEDSEDLKRALDQFPIFKRIYHQCLQNKTALLPYLQSVCHNRHDEKNSRYDILVNRQTSEIYFKHLHKKIKSDALAKALSALEQNGFLPADLENLRSWYNLSARLRQFMPANSVIREGKQLTRGPEWPHMKIVNQEDSPYEQRWDSLSLTKNQMVGTDAYLQAAKALLPLSFTRLQLEKRMKISKATACRMLEVWLEKGLLKKTGQARSIRYLWRTHE